MSKVLSKSHRFNELWKRQLDEAYKVLSQHTQQCDESYARLVILDALFQELLVTSCQRSAAEFLIEAENDYITSHMFAFIGSWRSSLSSLRSYVENLMRGQYYAEHPIELELWVMGKHQIGFQELYNYFLAHPHICSLGETHSVLNGLSEIKSQYSILSKAVHGSAKPFRMSTVATVKYFGQDVVQLNKWQTNSARVMKNTVRLILCLYKDSLQGTAHLSLRTKIASLFEANEVDQIQTVLGINLHIA